MALLVAGAAPGLAQERDSGTIAQLYSYRVHDEAAFARGYAEHLRWHAVHDDSLTWYAWTVRSGDRIGTFVDGVFGVSLAALDARPDPAGDGADFVRTTAPHSTPTGQETLKLWTAASTARPLEQGRPAKILDVFFIEVAPAAATKFEAAVESLVSADQTPGAARISWYRRLRGGALPGYLLIIGRDDWRGTAGLESLSEILRAAYRQPSRKFERLLAAVTAIRSESWSYRSNLAYFPKPK